MDSNVQIMVGAIKIKDGLFIGDELAVKDLEFIVTNKVTHVINAAGRQIQNMWENMGIKYFTFNWIESDNQVLFDQKGQVIQEIYNFIEGAHNLGESVLVHSVRGQSRACCVLSAYFMKKYRWNLYKTLEYLNSRRPDLEIRASFFHQLNQLEHQIAKTQNLSKDWVLDPNEDPTEQLLTITFLNAKSQPFAEYLMNISQKQLTQARLRKASKLVWLDEDKDKGQKKKLYQIFGQTQQGKKVAGVSTKKLKTEENKPKKSYVQSILKGSKKVFNLIGQVIPENMVDKDILKQNAQNNTIEDKSVTRSLNLKEGSAQRESSLRSSSSFNQQRDKNGKQKIKIKQNQLQNLNQNYLENNNNNSNNYSYIQNNGANKITGDLHSGLQNIVNGNQGGVQNNSKGFDHSNQQNQVEDRFKNFTHFSQNENNYMNKYGQDKPNSAQSKDRINHSLNNENNKYDFLTQSMDKQNKNLKGQEATLNKMLQKSNPYHADIIYNKSLSKSMESKKNQSNIGKIQDNKDQNPLVAGYQNMFKNTEQKSTSFSSKMQKRQVENNQKQNVPIRANADIRIDRPQSANIYNKQNTTLNNNFMVNGNNNNNVQQNQNHTEKQQRPSSTGAQLRSYSPGAKNQNPQIKSNIKQPQQVLSNNNKQSTKLRYPSPALASQYKHRNKL